MARRLSEEDKERIQHMYCSEHMSKSAIGKEFGISTTAVFKLIKKMGWDQEIDTAPTESAVKLVKKARAKDKAVKESAELTEHAQEVQAAARDPCTPMVELTAATHDLVEIISQTIGDFKALAPDVRATLTGEFPKLANALRTCQATLMQSYGIMTPGDAARVEVLRRQIAIKEEDQRVDAEPIEVTFNVYGDDKEGEDGDAIDNDPTV